MSEHCPSKFSAQVSLRKFSAQISRVSFLRNFLCANSGLKLLCSSLSTPVFDPRFSAEVLDASSLESSQCMFSAPVLCTSSLRNYLPLQVCLEGVLAGDVFAVVVGDVFGDGCWAVVGRCPHRDVCLKKCPFGGCVFGTISRQVVSGGFPLRLVWRRVVR